MLRHPAVPYVLPFAVFLLFLALQPYNPLPGPIEQVVRVAILTAVLWFFSRSVLDMLRYVLRRRSRWRIRRVSGSL